MSDLDIQRLEDEILIAEAAEAFKEDFRYLEAVILAAQSRKTGESR